MSPSALLQKWQKNQIFETIQGAGLDPGEFDFENGDAEGRVKHKWSDSYFIIGGNAGHYVTRYAVGDTPAWSLDAYSWTAVIQRLSGWLAEVKRDLETPDLWAELQREAELLGGASNEADENAPFSPEEQKEILGRLQELAEYVRRRYSLSESEMQILNAKVDYLVVAADHLGRIDWRNVFAGVILGFVLTAAVPPESARYIVLTLLRAIRHFYGLPELPGG
jgi:hypothetical protein